MTIDVGTPTPPKPRKRPRRRARSTVASSLEKIRVVPRGTQWLVTWSVADVSQQRICGTEDEANQFADSLRKMFKQGSLEVIAADQSMITMFSYCWKRLGENGLFDMLQREVLHSKAVEITVLGAITTYVRSLERGGRSKVYISNVKNSAKRFGEVCHKVISEITSKDLKDYLDSIPNAVTRQTEQRRLETFFKFALSQGWIADAKQVPKVQVTHEPVVRFNPQIYTPQEMKALIGACECEDLLAMLVIGGFCGVRVAEIMRMTWACWQPADPSSEDHGFIVLSNDITKTKKRRFCKVTTNAAAWLGKLSEGHAPEDKIYSLKLCSPEPMKVLHDKAGVQRKNNGMRHSYASYHLALLNNPPLTSMNCGHSIDMLMEHYMQLTSWTAAKDWFNINPPQ